MTARDTTDRALFGSRQNYNHEISNSKSQIHLGQCTAVGFKHSQNSY